MPELSQSGYGVDPKAREVLDAHERMRRDRSNFDPIYTELRELCRPDSAPFHSSVTDLPGEGSRRIYDGTAPWAAEMLASGLHSYLSNPVDRWATLAVAGRPANTLPFRAKAWLDEVSELIYAYYAIPQAGLNTSLHETYLDLATYGTGALYHLWDNELRIPRFRSYPLGSIWIEESAGGDIVRVQRLVKWKVSQVRQEFGGLPVKLSKFKDEDQVSVLHDVKLNPDYDASSRVPAKKRWTDRYVCIDTTETLESSGLDRLPYLVPRWTKLCGERYGRGPAMSVLPEIRMVNTMSKTMIRAAQKMVDPPLMVEDDGYMLPIRSTPGSLIRRRAGAEPILPLPTAQRIDVGVEMIEQRREMIRRGFYIDWIVRGQKKERQTAFEVQDERSQMLSLMAPIVGRLQSELLGPQIRLTYFYLVREGLVKPPPPEIEGLPLEIVYVSPAAKAQSTARGQGMLNYVQQLAQLLPIMPSLGDSINETEFNAELQDQLDVPRRVLSSPEEIEEKRQAREQQQQMAQMAQLGPAMAKSAKDLASARAQGMPIDV